MSNSQVAAASVTNTAVIFLAMLPPPSTLLASESIPRSYRVNEAAAVIVSLGVGIALSFVDDSGAPFIMALVTSAAMVGGLEYLFRSNIATLRQEMEYAPDRRI